MFSRIVPFAGNNTRIILVNRRDYPDSVPFNDTERSLLESAMSTDPKAAEAIGTYMTDRAQDLHDFLEALVLEEDIPLGSVIVAGWSFGSTFILALAAHAASLSAKNPSLPLTKYIKRFVIYGTLIEGYLAPSCDLTRFVSDRSTLSCSRISPTSGLVQSSDSSFSRSRRGCQALLRLGLRLLPPWRLPVRARASCGAQGSTTDHPHHVS